MLGRCCAAVMLGVVTVALAATPASAHTVSGPRPTNFRTTVNALVPPVPGLQVRSVDVGNKLELTNRTPTDVIVLGYGGEPYLRVGPRGVFDNRLSQATYLNRTRAGTTPVPVYALHTTALTPPEWRRVSGGRTAIWHDHRTHWMPAQLPAAVRAAPGRFHDIGLWTVPLRLGSRHLSVHGDLAWIPGPSGLPWIPVIAVTFLLAFAAVRSRRVWAGVSLLAVMVAGDMAHTISAEMARAGTVPGKTLQFFGDNFVSVIVWLILALAVVALLRRRVEALYGILLGGVMVALVSGVTDLSYLWSSQLPTVEAHPLARAEVACALGLGLGAAAAALLVLHGSTRAPRAHEPDDAHWVEGLLRDLDDAQVGEVCGRLVADEVIPRALGELARRAAPVADAFGNDALVFVVLAQDEVGSHVWSLVASGSATGKPGSAGGRLHVRRGTPAPARAEVRTTFPVLMQLLAGARTLDECEAADGARLVGDRGLLAEIVPYLAPAGTRLSGAGRGR